MILFGIETIYDVSRLILFEQIWIYAFYYQILCSLHVKHIRKTAE